MKNNEKKQHKLCIKKGDDVVVITGKYRGVKGKVLMVYPKDEKVIVENVAFKKRHTKPNKNNQQGGIIEKESPIHVSNVMLFNNKLNTVTKAVRVVKGDKRVRIDKKSGDELK
jgi:large subunit ribosomal protein L24